MADKKLITLSQLDTVKTYIDAKDEKAFKGVKFEQNELKFYTDETTSGLAAATVSLPAEMALDLTKTTLEENFSWDISTYPNSSDPSLDGKPVLVLAVKTVGDPDTFNYSFLAMADLISTIKGTNTQTANTTISQGNVSVDVQVSSEGGNAITTKSDGLYVATVKSVEISVEDNNIIEQKDDGLYATVKISVDGDNAITAKDDGIFAEKTKVSAEKDNALETKSDGLYVSKAALSDGITYADDAEVQAIFTV